MTSFPQWRPLREAPERDGGAATQRAWNGVLVPGAPAALVGVPPN
jgi:hypothetical protein